MNVDYFRVVMNLNIGDYYIHYSSKIDDVKYTKCSLSSKKWKRFETAEKWSKEVHPMFEPKVEHVIWDEYYEV